MRGLRFIAVVVLLFARSARAADALPLSDLLPPDTLAFAEIDPGANPANSNSTELIGMGLRSLQMLGVFKDAGVISDVLALAAETNHRSCVAWLDADLAVVGSGQPGAGAVPGGADAMLQCKSVQVVWILETAKPAEMVDRLTRLVANFSTRATAQQAVKKTAESRKQYVEFHDASWPAWLTLAWTQEPAGDNQPARFVLALGSGAMAHYLADRPVGDLPWHEAISRMAVSSRKAGDAGAMLARVYVSPRTLRERFPVAMQRTVLRRLFASLDLATAEASVFTARIQNRAISLSTATLDNNAVTVSPWTVALAADSPLLRAVPADATAYLVLNMQWGMAYARLCSLFDAILNDPTDVPTARQIADFAGRQHVDFEKDILDHLQPLVLVHDSPQHPLHLPLMVTAIAAVDAASEEKVRTSMTKLAAGLGGILDEKAGVGQVTPEVSPESAKPAGGSAAGGESTFSRLRVRTDADGISYLQFGLVGPALGFSGNRIVISWSPAAVRLNIGLAGRAPASAFTP